MEAGLILYLRDITEQKRTELEGSRLLEERQRFFTVTEGSPDFIAMCDRQAKLFYANPAAIKLIGIKSLDRVNALEIREFFFPEDQHLILHEFLPAVLREGHGEIDIRLRHFTIGTPIWMRCQFFLLRDAANSAVGFACISRDLTPERLNASAGAQTERLAAVGRLVASIVHEINNPLDAIGNLLYLSRTSDDLLEIRDYINTAERELQRVSAITHQTLRFHKQSPDPAPVLCQELIEQGLFLFERRLVNLPVVVERRKQASKPVNCFEGEIRQVLNNLIGNAIDAMQSAGGRLILRSREATDWKTGHKGLSITVADTGAGMTLQVQNKIFEPFFTTKGVNGTGLGLWICHEIVKRHHGALRVRSSQAENRHGTVFTLFLPLVQ